MSRVLQALFTHCKSYSKGFVGKACSGGEGCVNESGILVTAVGSG